MVKLKKDPETLIQLIDYSLFGAPNRETSKNVEDRRPRKSAFEKKRQYGPEHDSFRYGSDKWIDGYNNYQYVKSYENIGQNGLTANPNQETMAVTRKKGDPVIRDRNAQRTLEQIITDNANGR